MLCVWAIFLPAYRYRATTRNSCSKKSSLEISLFFFYYKNGNVEHLKSKEEKTMTLLETRGDYQFAENVEELIRKITKLNEAFEEQLEENQRLTASVKLLTEAITEQTEATQKLLRSYSVPVTNNRPDVVLM